MLARRVAEEFGDVMPEDDAVGIPADAVGAVDVGNGLRQPTCYRYGFERAVCRCIERDGLSVWREHRVRNILIPSGALDLAGAVFGHQTAIQATVRHIDQLRSIR